MSEYEHGEGVQKNPGRAAELYQSACARDHPRACLYLGFAYADGRGVKPDLSQAAAFYTSACESGNLEGCKELGSLLAKGWAGAPAEPERARPLLEKACKGGIGDACAVLKMLK